MNLDIKDSDTENGKQLSLKHIKLKSGVKGETDVHFVINSGYKMSPQECYE